MVIVDPSLKDVWFSARVIRTVHGLTIGLMQFTYQVFLYEHFGASPAALKITVALYLVTSLCILLLEIPTGAWGDYAGRKRTLIACFLTGALAWFFRSWVFFIDSSFISILIAGLAAIFCAISFTLFTGTYTAWVVDAVREREVPSGHGPILAGVYSYMMVGKIIGSVLGLWFYLSGVVFYASGLASVISLVCALFIAIRLPETHSYVNQPKKALDLHALRQMKQIFVTGWNISLRNPPVRYVIMLTASFMIVVHLIGVLWPIAMKENFGVTQMSWPWYVVVFSGMVGSYLGTQFLSTILVRFQQLQRELQTQALWHWFTGLCLLMAIGILFLGYSKSHELMTLPIFIIGFFVFNFTQGFLMPAEETLLNTFIPEKNSTERATINSLGPMLTETLLILLAFPSSGPSGGSTVIGWMLPAGILFVLTCVIHLRMRRHLRLPVVVAGTMPVATLEESHGG